MKNTIFFWVTAFAIIVFPPLSKFNPSAAEIPNPIKGSYKLEKKYSPYLINFDLHVEPGATLEIEPGVILKFGTDGGVTVFGVMKAQGKNSEGQIIFTSAEKNGKWKNILITGEKSSQTILQYCLIENGTGKKAAFEEEDVKYSNKDKILGGGLAIINSSPVIENTLIQNNEAQRGGGIFIYKGRPTLTGNTVNNNRADSGGGAYFLKTDTARITKNTFRENKAERGGGVFFGQLDKTEFSENLINNNTVTGSGGGIYFYNTNIKLSANTIGENSSPKGGGIFLYGSESKLEKNIITGNKSRDHGGGIYNYQSNPTIIANTIVKNTATKGAGIYCSFFAKKLEMSGNKISDNDNEACNGCGLCQ